jgi:hypothetical protein
MASTGSPGMITFATPGIATTFDVSVIGQF